MMKILIVEDEIKTGEYLSKGLTEAGFVVDHADNGLTGYHLAMTAEYDLVILDIMLPDVNGWDIIRMLRSAGKGMPVLLLTALGTIEHRVKGLELGADDYLVKPFAFAELLARVRTLLRRGNTMITESQLKVADLSVDLVSRKVSRAGNRIVLTSKEFSLLEFFIRHQGEVLPRSLIASGRHRAVELLHHDCHLEAGGGPGLRLHHRPQTERVYAADAAARGGAGESGGYPGWGD